MPQSWGDTVGSKKGTAQIDRKKERHPDDRKRSDAEDDLRIETRRPRRFALILFDRPIDNRYRR